MNNEPKLFRCKHCGKDKPYAEMRKDKRYKSGIAKDCNACRAEARKHSGSYLKERIRKYQYRSGGKAVHITFEEMQALMQKKSCSYCGSELNLIYGDAQQQCVDHVYSIGAGSDGYGAENIALNLAISCRSCNTSKAQDHVYVYYQRSDKFTSELWNAFCADFARKLFDREPTADEIAAISQGFEEEAAVLAAKKGAPV